MRALVPGKRGESREYLGSGSGVLSLPFFFSFEFMMLFSGRWGHSKFSSVISELGNGSFSFSFFLIASQFLLPPKLLNSTCYALKTGCASLV